MSDLHTRQPSNEPRARLRGLRESRIGLGNKLARSLWNIVWFFLFRPTPRPMHAWRRMLLRLFGAKIGTGVRVYQSARIWAPWNLVMENDSCLGDFVDCYSVDQIHFGPRATVSQYSYLCTASHDYTRRALPLVTAPIHIGADAWVTADVFVGPGVSIGEGSVVGARSTVTRDVPAWVVVAGSPPKLIGPREFLDG
jgi:putative colanic acid biosynthesis acetyltransferase WcaF